MTTLHIDCAGGIAGDMFVAACLDAGLVSIDDLTAVPRQLGLEGVEVQVERVQRASIAATHVKVVEPERKPDPSAKHGHTHYDRLDRRLVESHLPPEAKQVARSIFRLLAEAEAQAHGRSVERVVFHEVGSMDSIVDVAMAGVCVARIAASRVTASPVALGRGYVDIVHGRVPVPPPAAAYLARGLEVAAVPDGIERESVELATPTGLAILRALAPEFRSGWPGGLSRASGMGAGSMDLGRFANIVRVAVLEETDGRRENYEHDTVVEVTCTLDDQTPERTGWAAEQLLAMGALDVWVTPVIGKKGRPATHLSALVRPAEREATMDWILKSTSTFGVRYHEWKRWKLVKRISERPGPDGQAVRYAEGVARDGTVLKEKPEYEDMRRYWPGPSKE